MGDFAFTCSGLIQLIKIMRLPRIIHICQERLATKHKQNHSYLKIQFFKIVHCYKCTEVAKECFFPSTCTPLKPYYKEIILLGYAV